MTLEEKLGSKIFDVLNLKTGKNETHIEDIDFETISDFRDLKNILIKKYYPNSKNLVRSGKIPKVNNIHFSNCIFPDCLIFGDDLNILFDECDFKGFLCGNRIVNSKLKFYSCRFHKDVLSINIVFNKLIDFWSSTFFGSTIFLKSDFIDVSVFSSVTFMKNVLFTYSTFYKQSIFRHTKFKEGLDISLSNILGPVTFFEIEVSDDYKVFNHKSIEEYEDGVTEKGLIPLINKKETFRIIKHKLQETNNITYSLDFYKHEMKTYENILFSKITLSNKSLKEIRCRIISISKEKSLLYIIKLSFKRIVNYLNTLGDFIILILNKFSNNHKKSWVRSLFFITFFGFLIFYLEMINTEKYSFGYSLKIDWNNTKYFMDFLNPLHNHDYLPKNEFINFNNRFYIIDFIGRVVIGYGYYQFVQSFRKYK